MKVVAVILLGQLALAFATPIPEPGTASAFTINQRTSSGSSAEASASARAVRDAATSSGSGIDANGKTQISSMAVKTGDGFPVPVAPAPVPYGGSFSTPVNNNTVGVPVPSGPGPVSTVPAPVDVPANNNNSNNNNGPAPVESGPVGGSPVGPVPDGAVQRPHTKFQKVEAVADMLKGTAIASASKRDITHTTFQDVRAQGNVAITKAEDSTNADSSIQSAVSNGQKLAVATANSGIKFARDLGDKNIQAVHATGNKAIASASNSKEANTNIQSVNANGGELAIAKASSDSFVPVSPVLAPAPVDQGQAAPSQK